MSALPLRVRGEEQTLGPHGPSRTGPSWVPTSLGPRDFGRCSCSPSTGIMTLVLSVLERLTWRTTQGRERDVVDGAAVVVERAAQRPPPRRCARGNLAAACGNKLVRGGNGLGRTAEGKLRA